MANVICHSLYANSLSRLVGEIGVLFNSVRTATVVSKTKSLMGALTADVLQQKLEIFPEIKELLHSKGKERLQALEAAKKKGGASPSDQKVRICPKAARPRRAKQ